jgi:hypothetical protein
MGRPPGGRSPPKRATVIGIKLKPAHKSGYVFINHKQIALLLAASLIQSCFFTAQLLNSLLKLNSLSGLRPRPHARRGFSLLSSLLGASGFIQPTAVIMRHAKQSAPERPLKVSIFCIAPGQGFALKAAEWLCCLAPHACRLKAKPLNRISKQTAIKT